METNHNSLKRIGFLGTVCGGLLVGLAMASHPAAAEGDYGSKTPTGLSVVNYGDNNGEVVLPENAPTPPNRPLESEGDFGSQNPTDVSADSYGDNSGEVNTPSEANGTRNPNVNYGTTTPITPNYGTTTPTTPNYGTTTPSRPNYGTTTPTTPNYGTTTPTTPNYGTPTTNPSPDYGVNQPDGTSIDNYGENNQNVGDTRDPELAPNNTSPNNGAGNMMTEPSPDYGSSEPEGSTVDSYGDNNAR